MPPDYLYCNHPGRGIHVSGGVLVPQLAGELSILRLGAVTQYGIYVGAKRISIRRRRHERVVEVHIHLAEERMEPVIVIVIFILQQHENIYKHN